MSNDRTQQLIALGREHYHAGDYAQAEGYLAQAVAAAPTFPDLFNMLGVIYHSGGKFQLAQEAFEAALRLNPRYTEAALNLSVTYNDRGRYEQAREVYTRAVASSSTGPRQLDPYARGKLANGHADLGEAYAGMALYDDAVREYTRALDLCPQFVDLRVKLGGVYRDMGNAGAALAELERAKAEKPEYAPARIHLGVVLFSLGRPDDAVAEWQAVVAADPDGGKGSYAARAQLYLRMVSDRNAPQAGSALPRIALPGDDE
jgi:tetratricopeptide (TPR) repeat protein